jgi:hypothetical protein
LNPNLALRHLNEESCKQMMSAYPSLSRRSSHLFMPKFRATWVGLAISLFAMLVTRQVVAFLIPGTTFASASLKEALIWLSAATLLVIIRCGERLPMRSIGLGTTCWWKSILWGFIIAIDNDV